MIAVTVITPEIISAIITTAIKATAIIATMIVTTIVCLINEAGLFGFERMNVARQHGRLCA
jgi:hypothetical protein